jgi:hypothetical protein
LLDPSDRRIESEIGVKCGIHSALQPTLGRGFLGKLSPSFAACVMSAAGVHPTRHGTQANEMDENNRGDEWPVGFEYNRGNNRPELQAGNQGGTVSPRHSHIKVGTADCV